MTSTDPTPTPINLRRPDLNQQGGRFAALRRVLGSGVLLVGIMLCVLLTVVAISAAGGVAAGQKERNVRATATILADNDLQFGLGLTDLAEGRYTLAAQRFRTIIARNPDYPGAAERLAEAEAGIAAAAVSVETPIVEPTVARSEADDPAELFAEAEAFFNDQAWSSVIARLNQLRQVDPTYREVEVDEMLYTAQSTLGLAYIRGDRIEEGLFLLEQAEQIKPLDDFTAGERNLAEIYTIAGTYWDLDWHVVTYNLRVLYDLAPNYRDVPDLLFEAYVKYGDQLVRLGTPCDAVIEYESALDLRPDDTSVSEKLDNAIAACDDPSLLTPVPGSETPSGTPGEATETPPPGIGITPTPSGSETSSPTTDPSSGDDDDGPTATPYYNQIP